MQKNYKEMIQTLCSQLSRTRPSTPMNSSVQFSSVAQSCPTLCDPMNRSTPALPVHHQLPEFPQTHAHGVSDAIQPSNSLSSPSPPAPNPSQHQGLFQWTVTSFWKLRYEKRWERETFQTPSKYCLNQMTKSTTGGHPSCWQHAPLTRCGENSIFTLSSAQSPVTPAMMKNPETLPLKNILQETWQIFLKVPNSDI